MVTTKPTIFMTNHGDPRILYRIICTDRQRTEMMSCMVAQLKILKNQNALYQIRDLLALMSLAVADLVSKVNFCFSFTKIISRSCTI